MHSNLLFLKSIETSFKEFINSGTSRSTAKLKPLHGAIALDLAQRLGKGYKIWAQGYAEGKEKKIKGRYIHKMVDITIEDTRTNQPIAGIAIKFVMQNYSQNSNNYFENMLGETANIRTANCLYFQVLIILDRLPYYQNSGKLTKWETFTDNHIKKYITLAQDKVNKFPHTLNKTLIYVVHVEPEISTATNSKTAYREYYQKHSSHLSFTVSSHRYAQIPCGGTIIMNDYERFIEKVFHSIKAL